MAKTVIQWVRSLSKLTEGTASDKEVKDDYYPMAIKQLNYILDGYQDDDGEFHDYVVDEITDSIGDAYIDFVFALFICEALYTVKDWGIGFNGEELAEEYNQRALQKISFIKPGKVVYNPYHKRWYAKDQARGNALDEVAMYIPEDS